MLCKCGCGIKVKEGNSYVLGHNQRGKKNEVTGLLRKGKTYSEIYGSLQGELEKKKRKHVFFCKGRNKGKTYEEVYGFIKAKQLRGARKQLRVKREVRFCACGCGKSTTVLVSSLWQAFRGHIAWTGKRWNEGLTKKTDVRVLRMANILSGRKQSDGTRLKKKVSMEKAHTKNPYLAKAQSLRSRKHWSDPEYKQRTLRAIFKTLGKNLSGYERRLKGLIEQRGLPYMQNDGKAIILNKIPDFIHRFSKVVVEVYCTKHLGVLKPFNYEVIRSTLFKKKGYKTIFITERDLFRADWEEHCERLLLK